MADVKIIRKDGAKYARIEGRLYRLPATIFASDYRTGEIVSRSMDYKRKALKPGKRISKSGNIYYEYRRNRSDIKRI